jgi:hypothetical protein
VESYQSLENGLHSGGKLSDLARVVETFIESVSVLTGSVTGFTELGAVSGGIVTVLARPTAG